jgi:hypothetical protein
MKLVLVTIHFGTEKENNHLLDEKQVLLLLGAQLDYDLIIFF